MTTRKYNFSEKCKKCGERIKNEKSEHCRECNPSGEKIGFWKTFEFIEPQPPRFRGRLY